MTSNSEPKSAASHHTPPPLRLSVSNAAQSLQESYLGRRGERAAAKARGTLASLRSAVGRAPEDDLVAWQGVLESTLADGGDALASTTSEAPSRDERAAYDALTLFALHLQSQRQPMYVKDQSFARACGLLDKNRNSDSIKARFDAALVAANESVRRQHLRGLVTLLRADAIGFDYGWFALDLARLQTSRKNTVLLSWGRDYAIAKFTVPSESSADTPASE